jgi:hypothetical protein
VAVDFSFCDAVFAMQASGGLGVGSVAVFNSLLHAIYCSLHAQNVKHNIDELRLNTGHEASPVPTGN